MKVQPLISIAWTYCKYIRTLPHTHATLAIAFDETLKYLIKAILITSLTMNWEYRLLQNVPRNRSPIGQSDGVCV